MNKVFTKITSLALGAAMMIGVGVSVASNKEVNTVDASPETGYTAATMTAGTNGSSCTVNGYDGIKVGTSSKGGDMSITVPSGATKLVLYAAAWKGVTGLSLNITKTSGASSAAISSSSIALTADTGISNNSPFTLSGTESNYRFELTLTNITANTVYKFASSATKRFVVWSAQTQAATTYTISYNANGGTGTMASTAGADPEVAACTFTAPSGKEFGYWHTTTSGTGGTTYAAGDHPKKNVGLYAIWVNQKVLSSIAVTTPPTTTTYTEGQSFNSAGMVVTATFDDASTSNVTSSCTFAPSGALSTSDTSITVSYTHNAVTKTTTQAITVKETAHYELITDASGLVSGCNYLIGAYVSDTYRFMSTTQNTNNRGHHVLSGSVVDNKVGYEEGMEIITLGGSTGEWTLYANGETSGYLRASGAADKNYLTTNAASSTWTITFTDSVPTLTSAAKDSRNILRYNSTNNPPVFSCYGSGQSAVSLWKEVSTAESISISKDSTSGFKGDTDTTVSITAVNFDPTNIEVSYSTSGVATVTKGTISNRIIPLNVAFNGAGTTTATITVKGGKADYSVDLGVSVEAKPSILRVVESRTANPLVDITSIEIKNGDSTGHSFTKLNIYVEDTDGDAIEIGTISDYVTLSRISGDDCVTISGGKITGKAVGTAVVKFELNSLTSVYDTVTVSVSNDYKDSVNSITFNSSLTATQGDSVDASEVFATRVANTHFGSTETIADSEFIYSYSNNRSGAEAYNVFSYDYSHGTTVDSTHKSQTIYVFVTFNEEYSDSFTITVEQKNDPLTAITLTNVVNNEVDVNRGSSFQLEWAYTPTNPTDGKEVVFRIDDNTDGIGITVSQTGLINISADSDLGTALVVIESAHKSTIYDYVYVTASLESMTYTVREEESWTLASSLSVGDRVAIVYENGDTLEQLSGVSNNIGQHTSYTTAGEPSTEYLYTVGSGNVANSFTFSNEDGYLAYTSQATSGTNNLHLVTNPSGDDQLNQVSWTIDFSNYTIQNVYNTGRSIRYNTGSPRFCCYINKGQAAPKIYKLSGGDTPYNVTEVLFNGVHNNFGTGKTYEWDATCSEFDENAWLDACVALTEITSYSSYKLNRAVANESGNEVEVFLAKYDNIVRKFGDTHDHLDRFAVGGINHGTITRVNPLNTISNSGTEVAIIVVTSMIGLSALGGFFFLRKRKEI